MRNFDEEIEIRNEQIGDFKIELRKIQEKFKINLTSFFKELYSTQSKKLVVENAEMAIEIGEENLGLLKKEVQVLLDNVSNVVEKHIEKEVLWWHLKENGHAYTHYSEHRIPEFLDEECRYIYGEIGEIFSKHKMITVQDSNLGITRSTQSGFNRKNGKVRFAYGFELSEDARATLTEYSEVHQKATNLSKEIEKIKREKMKERIGDVWDSL